MKRRGSGILLHITSLPSLYGIGDLGPAAFRFADFLAEAKQQYWQVLPLNPTQLVHHNSPYHACSAFALNPLFISLEFLIQDGLLESSDMEPLPGFSAEKVDYPRVASYKENCLSIAYERFKAKSKSGDYERFCRQNSCWLDDFALFVALKSHFGTSEWSEWPQEFKDRNPESLRLAGLELLDRVEQEKFRQYVFCKQWFELKTYCNENGVKFIGDIPIYVTYDSADVWVHPDMFKLDADKRPSVVAGVPPDYFSETGQLWGNPVYNWEVLRQKDYRWWIQRIRHNLNLFDYVRLDHFRGFVKYWEVPVDEKTAENGQWINASAYRFFDTLFRRFPCLPVIAEDLGVITSDVREVLNYFEFPGMKVLMFAFGKDFPSSVFLPHNYVKTCVAYTGTHDNNTLRGWYENEATADMKSKLRQYIGGQYDEDQLHWEMIRLLMMSPANTVIIPMQDVLGLGSNARMNQPATHEGNWQWRLSPQLITQTLISRILALTETYERV
jgi:4-alpha-glucanotransferase